MNDTIVEIDFREEKLRIFCVVYGPKLHKMNDFLPNFEELLQFLRTLKHEAILFGDFNIDTIKDSKDKSDYQNLNTA